MNGDERGEEEESVEGRGTDGRHGLGAVFPIKVTHTQTERALLRPSKCGYLFRNFILTSLREWKTKYSADICSPYKCLGRATDGSR